MIDPSSSNQPIDPQLLAALLDGRLDERRRAEVLELLASSTEGQEVLADAVAVVRELESGEEVGVVHPAGPHPGPRGLWPIFGRRWTPRSSHVRWIAIAAVLAAIAVAPWVWTRLHEGALDDPAMFAELLTAEHSQIPAVWSRQPWVGVRAVEIELTPRARAVRLGARLTDLEVAVQARDTAVANLAAQIAILLEGIPAAAPVASVYRDIARRAGDSPASLQPLLKFGRTRAAQLAGEDFVRLGAWTEAARMAAARRDAGFFNARATREVLSRGASLPAMPDSARASISRIEAELQSSRQPAWGTLESELFSLLQMLAS